MYKPVHCIVFGCGHTVYKHCVGCIMAAFQSTKNSWLHLSCRVSNRGQLAHENRWNNPRLPQVICFEMVIARLHGSPAFRAERCLCRKHSLYLFMARHLCCHHFAIKRNANITWLSSFIGVCATTISRRSNPSIRNESNGIRLLSLNLAIILKFIPQYRFYPFFFVGKINAGLCDVHR